MGHWYSCKLNTSHENIKESLLILSYWILSSLKSNSNNSNEPNEASIAEKYTHFELCDVIHFFRAIVKNFLQLLWNRRYSSYVSEFTRFYFSFGFFYPVYLVIRLPIWPYCTLVMSMLRHWSIYDALIRLPFHLFENDALAHSSASNRRLYHAPNLISAHSLCSYIFCTSTPTHPSGAQ